MANNKTLGILEVGLVREDISAGFDTYPQMFETLLSAADPDLNYQTYTVVDGDMPDSPSQCDAWLITGSRHGVYEDHDWIEPLSDFVREAYANDIPLVGICFGHQLMAQALGGKVIKSNKGWGVGVHHYDLKNQPDWMKSPNGKVKIHAFHQDHVVEVPEGAEVIASSEFCENAGLIYGKKGISFQGHPEFQNDYQLALLKLFTPSLLPTDLTKPEIDKMNAGEVPDTAMLAQWITRFLKEAV
ncbi:MAG: GMP synthase-like glutamine amidotransferase [Saprospiraceae bacterium]|jgi:GMP synthase-like glutamine amidotransferase